MVLKQKMVSLAMIFGVAIAFCAVLPGSMVLAAPGDGSDTGTASLECNGVKTSIIGGDICTSEDNTDAENSTIYHLLIEALKIMTAGVGIAAVGGIVYGALLYTTAEDKPDQTKRAIGIITNVVIGLVAYGLMFVLLNYLIPGGIFT